MKISSKVISCLQLSYVCVFKKCSSKYCLVFPCQRKLVLGSQFFFFLFFFLQKGKCICFIFRLDRWHSDSDGRILRKFIYFIYFSSESISNQVIFFQYRVRLIRLAHFALNCNVLYHKGFKHHCHDDDNDEDNEIYLQKASSVSFCYI